MPSHLEIDPAKRYLYVADTGGARILRVDLKSGAPAGTLPTDDSQMPTIARIDGAKVDVIVPPGVVERPSGVALHEDTLLVTDDATGKIQLFDLAGTRLTSLDTGLPPGSIAGVEVGPDGRVYFTDREGGALLRVEPR